MELENIIKAIAQDETINVMEYIENNLNILLDNYPIFMENIDTITFVDEWIDVCLIDVETIDNYFISDLNILVHNKGK